MEKVSIVLNVHCPNKLFNCTWSSYDQKNYSTWIEFKGPTLTWMQGLFHFNSAKNSCPMNQLDGKRKLTVCAFKFV